MADCQQNHIGMQHSEDQSPFAGKHKTEQEAIIDGLLAEQARVNYVECPMEGCGEVVLSEELNNHLDMHVVEHEAASVDDLDRVSATVSTENDESSSMSEPDRCDGSVSKDLSKGPHRIDTVSEKSTIGNQEAAKAVWKKLMNMPGSAKHKGAITEINKGPRKLGVRWQIAETTICTNLEAESRTRSPRK